MTPKTLVLDVLAAFPDDEVPVAALVRAAAIFDISSNNLRVTLSRMRAADLVCSEERGAYRMGPAAEAINQEKAQWRTALDALRPWRGTWVGVHTAALGRSDRGALRRRERALSLLGFRELDGALFVRPDNLAGGVDGLRRRLHRLGLEAEARVFGVTDLEVDAAALWDLDTIEQRYADQLEALSRSTARLPTLPHAEAAHESFLVGGAAIRAILLDPRLPEPMVDGVARAALVDAMKAYDEIGRSIWWEVLALESEEAA